MSRVHIIEERDIFMALKKEKIIQEALQLLNESELEGVTLRREDDSLQDWLILLFIYLRKVLLSHTDGGRVVAGAHLSLTMANISETAISTLVDAEVTLRQSRLIVLTATRFTFGHVIEEQTN